MSGISLGSSEHDSARQRASVSDRGAGFGDVYLYTSSGEVEIRFCWTGNGNVWVPGVGEPTRAQKNRAVRALAETPQGRKALGLPQDFDSSTFPSAEEEELSELRSAAQAAGLLSSEAATVAASAAPTTSEVVVGPGVTVEVNITVQHAQ